MDPNRIIARAKAILVTPKTEWPVIAQEPATVGDLFRNYIVWLAAIPAVFQFLQMSVIGTNVWLAGRMRFGVGMGLSAMVVGYVLALIGVYVMGIIIDALAPTFGGQKDRVQALKTIGYASTAYWIAAIATILPGLGWLIALAGAIYSIYLLYLGLPHTMKAPQEKAAGYTAVAIIVALVVNILVGAVVGSVLGLGAGSFMRSAGMYNSAKPASGDVQFDPDSTLGKLEKWTKDVESAGKKLDSAQKSGNQQAQEDALKSMVGTALGSGGEVESLAPDQLKPFLPESLAGMQRSNFSTQRNSAMGLQISEAKATYTNGAGRSIDLEITDTGNAQGLLALAGWAGLEGEQETDHGYEKTYRLDGRLTHESWDRSSSRGEYSVVLGERFTVKVAGDAGSVDELKAVLTQLDLRALEALKGQGVKAAN